MNEFDRGVRRDALDAASIAAMLAPCRSCRRKRICHSGFCVECLVRGMRTLQAVARPVAHFLTKNGYLAYGQRMPMGNNLYKLLSSTRADAHEMETGDGLSGEEPQGEAAVPLPDKTVERLPAGDKVVPGADALQGGAGSPNGQRVLPPPAPLGPDGGGEVLLQPGPKGPVG